MGVSEARQEAAARLGAERVDELPSKESERDRVEDQRSLQGEPDDAACRFEVQELVVIQIARPQAGPLKVIAQRITLNDSRRAPEAGRRSVIQ